jgi:hypothetical protein
VVWSHFSSRQAIPLGLKMLHKKTRLIFTSRVFLDQTLLSAAKPARFAA